MCLGRQENRFAKKFTDCNKNSNNRIDCEAIHIELGNAGEWEMSPDSQDVRTLKLLKDVAHSIQCVPLSIGKPLCLKMLHLQMTKRVFRLPDDIGSLARLGSLDLRGSHIRCLPSSIGNLKNLRCLALSRTMNLSCPPNEIGNLGKLEALRLDTSNIMHLSRTIGDLQILRHLHLGRTKNMLSLPVEIR